MNTRGTVRKWTGSMEDEQNYPWLRPLCLVEGFCYLEYFRRKEANQIALLSNDGGDHVRSTPPSSTHHVPPSGWRIAYLLRLRLHPLFYRRALLQCLLPRCGYSLRASVPRDG
jgi:hypothetical protein